MQIFSLGEADIFEFNFISDGYPLQNMRRIFHFAVL